jgi:micrococcal nuclease
MHITPRNRAFAHLVAVLILGTSSSVAAQVAGAPVAPAPAPKTTAARAKPTELFEIVKVVDGDTIHIQRAGKTEKLRLLSVDTEERIGNGAQASGTKPATVFGEECALWAQQFFAELGHDGKAPKIGLAFPGGVEKRDFYGRLLCHVILPDGTDFNLKLVEMGKSPYFTKYGYDEVEHDALRAAQERARGEHLGIWNPKTNEPQTEGAPSAKRPYAKLVPWWDARGAAVQSFRAALAKDPSAVCDADDPESLARAVKSEKDVEVFGEIDQVRAEPDGSIAVRFRASVRDKALLVRIPADQRAAYVPLDLDGLALEFRQNYAWFKGRVSLNEKGFAAISEEPARWRRAGPEPKIPE